MRSTYELIAKFPDSLLFNNLIFLSYRNFSLKFTNIYIYIFTCTTAIQRSIDLEDDAALD